MEQQNFLPDSTDSRQDCEEIDLISCLKAILRYKWLIVAMFVFGLLFAGAYSFYPPQKYKAEIIIETGSWGQETLGTPDSIIRKIKGGFYGNYPTLEASNFAGTNLIKISITSSNAKSVLEDLTRSILSESDKQMNEKKQEVAVTNENKKQEVKEMNEIQKNILDKTIESLKTTISFLLSQNKEVENLELALINLQKERLNLTSTSFELVESAKFVPAKIYKEISVSKNDSKFVFNLIVGGILGLFLGICWVFLKEWWEKNKERLRT